MATLKDLAAETGLSVSTVSVVMRGDAARFGIKNETVELVRARALKIGYVKNDFARAMASGKSRVLGFVSNSAASVEYAGRQLYGALQKVSELGYSLRVFHYPDGEEPEGFLSGLQSQNIRGLLLSGELGRESIDRLMTCCIRHDIFCVSVNLSNRIGGIGVVSDDTAGMSELVKYLIGAGHSRIAYYGTGHDPEYAQKRRDGYRTAMKEAGLSPLILHTEQKVELKSLLERKISAVVCDSDYLAARMMQQAYQEGTAVPEAISICGFGGTQIADFAASPLTTVAQDFEGMGAAGAEKLIEMLEHPRRCPAGKTENIRLATSLKIQKTTRRADHAQG